MLISFRGEVIAPNFKYRRRVGWLGTTKRRLHIVLIDQTHTFCKPAGWPTIHHPSRKFETRCLCLTILFAGRGGANDGPLVSQEP